MVQNFGLIFGIHSLCGRRVCGGPDMTTRNRGKEFVGILHFSTIKKWRMGPMSSLCRGFRVNTD